MKSQFPEFVHEETHPRSRRADMLAPEDCAGGNCPIEFLPCSLLGDHRITGRGLQ